MNNGSKLNLARILDKERDSFTRQDLLGAVGSLGIGMVNFRFVAGDGRLKTFSFTTTERKKLERLLAAGERVDGSSLFPYIDAGSSDLYVIPRYGTAFMDPFAEIPTLDLLCSFFTNTGEPLPSSPENIVRKAHEALKNTTGMSMEALAELEYYMVSRQGAPLYPGRSQRGYGESSPFTRWEALRLEAMFMLSQMGYPVKYGHSEVGKASDDAGEQEQAEIEFNLAPLEVAADAVVVARWVLRMLAARAGAVVTFAPKLQQGHAGSGLHVHSRLVKNGECQLATRDGLTETAYRMIGGMLTLAGSLTAFGNTVPISYLRLVPNQEAPVYVCWGERNRSTLIRVPLGWTGVGDMAAIANPQESLPAGAPAPNQTIEFRSPDGSADIHLLLAGLSVAARHGLEMPDSLELARRLHVDSNIFAHDGETRRHGLPRLPSSCQASAEAFLADRAVYEAQSVFSPTVVEGVCTRLTGFGDEEAKCRSADFESLNKIIARYLHCS